jgi:Mg-chelatase subunit ChlD
MRFAAPFALVLLACIPWFWWIAGRPRRLSARSAALRCAAAAALALAIARTEIGLDVAPLDVMFLVDRSQSMRDQDAEVFARLDDLFAQMRPGDRAGVMMFGANTALERPLGGRVVLGRPTAVVDDTGSNLELAIGAASATLPARDRSRIVLLSDGQQTAGDGLRGAAQARARGTRVDVVELSRHSSSTRDPAVTRVAAAPVVRAGEPFLVTVTAEGMPGGAADVVLRGDEGQTAVQAVTFGTDGLATASFAQPPGPAGIRTYRAASLPAGDGADAAVDSDDAGTVVVVSGDPRVLYVGPSASLLGPALARAGFRVTHVPSPAALPRTPTALQDYDAVLLDNVGAPAIDIEQSRALELYAERAGGGVIVLGGPKSLEPGIPADHPFRRMLPVDLRPRGGRRGPSVALVIVFDKSGSMDDRVGGAQKIEIARQAVRRVIDTLPATDAVGVIAFDSNAVPVTPLATGADANTLTARLREIRPGGSTALSPALEMARAWIRTPEALRFDRRHVLLISDGRTSESDARRAGSLVETRDFELTAVAIGAGSDRSLLDRLATATGGRAYFPDDVRQLPSILAREAARVAGGGIAEETFTPRPFPHPLLAGLEDVRFPDLGGYVVGAARASSSVALASHLEDPVLATWQFGLGRVALYTADLHSPWSSRLRASETLGPLFVQTTRWVARHVRDDHLYAKLTEEEDGVRLSLDAWTPEGAYRTLLDARASIRAPSGDAFETRLTEAAPGRYEAQLPLRLPGPYVVTAGVASPDGRFNARLVRGFFKSDGRERRTRGVNAPFLEELAAATGGQVFRAGEGPFTMARPLQYRDMRPWLLGIALALFLADVLAPAVLHWTRAWRIRRRTAAQRVEAA